MSASGERVTAVDERGAPSAVFSPLYQQIKELLVAALDRGEWKPGELIPSEQDLAMRFQVSQGTVRKAIDELANEHLLIRRQGKGTFVATHHEPRAQHRFLRIGPDSGAELATSSRFIECKRINAPAQVAAQLDLDAGDAVVHVRRLLFFGVRPIVLDDLWLPGAAFKGLTAERLAGYHGPLYGLFETEFGTRMIRADERLRAIAAEAESAALLHVAPGVPLLQIERVSFTYGDRPVEVRHALGMTNGFHYRNTLV